MNAHRIPRTGLARARAEHLQAANDEGCGRCKPHDNRQGRDCECSRQSTREVLRTGANLLAPAAWLLVPVVGWTLVYVIASWLAKQ